MAPLPDGAFKRIAFDGAAGSGAILVDATDAGAIGVAHFEPRFWIARDAVIAEARGRGSTWIVRSARTRSCCAIIAAAVSSLIPGVSLMATLASRIRSSE